MKYLRLLVLFSLNLILFILFAGCGEEVPVGHFSATMVERDGETSRTAKLYVDGSRYRFDLTLPSGPITLLVDKEQSKAHIISPNDKEYTIVALDNSLLVNRDPFLAVEFLKTKGTTSEGKKERVLGYNCRKEILSINDKPLLTQWIADDLAFPIRIENHLSASKYIELTDIVREEVSDDLFLVPAGFKELVARPEATVPIPEWANDLSKVRTIDTPFERNFAEGDIIRIPVRAESSIWIKAEPLPGRTADVRAIPFANGRPLQPEEEFTNIADSGVVCARRSETPREASEIIVRVYEGVANITARGVATSQKLLQDGKVGILALRTELMLEEFRLINSTGEQAIVSWDFYDDDVPLIADEFDVSISGRVTLEPYEVKRSTIEVPGNRLHIRSEKGDVWICLGQWDPSKF